MSSFTRDLIDLARKEGRVIEPNKLPMASLNSNNIYMEDSNADHESYIKPMMVQYIGKNPTDIHVPCKKMDSSYYQPSIEQHSLIFNDGSCAITIFECCYFMWMRHRSLPPEFESLEVFQPYDGWGGKNTLYDKDDFILRDFLDEEKIPWYEKKEGKEDV